MRAHRRPSPASRTVGVLAFGCATRNSEPRFEVMTISVLRKSTVRPWPSVRRPSSSTCSSTLKTSSMRLLDLVEQHHLIGPPPHRFGQHAALVVADIARRRADQPRHRMLLHEFAHVDAHHRGARRRTEFGERLGQLGLADAGRAQEHERADRPVRVLQPARAAHRGRDRLARLRPGRPRACASCPPCAAACRARLPASCRPARRSSATPPARCDWR
jgi:hypothetical protein